MILEQTLGDVVSNKLLIKICQYTASHGEQINVLHMKIQSLPNQILRFGSLF